MGHNRYVVTTAEAANLHDSYRDIPAARPGDPHKLNRLGDLSTLLRQVRCWLMPKPPNADESA
jgi:hypothetical protein